MLIFAQDAERQSQTEARDEEATGPDIRSNSNGSPALGANAGLSSARSDVNYALGTVTSQTAIESLAPSVNLPHYTNAQESGTIGHRQDADGDLPLQHGTEPNPDFGWDTLLGDISANLNFEGMEFHYDSTVNFR